MPTSKINVADDGAPNDNRPDVNTVTAASTDETAAATDSPPPAPATSDADVKADALVTAKSALAELDAQIDALTTAKQDTQKMLDQAIKARDQSIQDLQEVTRVEDVEIIRRIQRQTMEQAQKRKDAMGEITKVMRESGMPLHASQLDAALAAGGSRSIAFVNGQPVRAANPRSREGAQNYSKYLQQEAKANTPAARGLV